MKILDKAAKLEKALLEKFARRTDIPRHPLEVYQSILDAIEDAVEPGTRGGRIFPYNKVLVVVPTTDAVHRATAEAVFDEPPSLDTRARARLQDAGCGPTTLSVAVKFVDATDEWAGRDYQIEFKRQAAGRDAKRTTKAAPKRSELHLAVLAGDAERTRYAFDDVRINLGRLTSVVDRQQRVVRQNQVAFADTDDEINQSVSRTHAHVRFDADSGEARLHDDGSTHGTRVLRGGRTLEAPRGGRGIALRDGDEVVLGRARLRVTLKPARRS